MGVPAEVEQSGVQRVEPVHVLHRVDGADDLRLVDLGRHRRLDEDAVDRVVGVQLLDELEHFLLARVDRQPYVPRLDPRLRRGFVLAADVDLRRGIVPDENRGQAEPAEGLDLPGDLRPDARCKRRAVHQCPHARNVSLSA